MWQTWMSMKLWQRVLIGLVLGALLGLGLRAGLGAESAGNFATTYLKPFGDGFVRLIRMLVVPLIFTTLVAGVTAMGHPKKLGSLGGAAIGLYMITTWFAVSLGLLMGTLFKPGAGVEYSTAGSDTVTQIEGIVGTEPLGLVERLLAIIPANPVEALATMDVLGIIFFAIFFGIGILRAGEKGEAVGKAIESAADAMLKVTELIMEAAPYGVFALMSWVMATQGLGVLENLLRLAAALYIACILHIIVIYGGLIKFILRLPLIRFFRGVADAQAVAFSTASSSATLPVTIAVATDNLGIKRAVASSVLPLGATINMDGTACYLGLIALFAAQAVGIDLTFGHYAMIALTATLASIGAAGIPSASLLLAMSVFEVIGVPPEQGVLVIAFIFPFDRLLDMMRTATNVTGDLAVASTVAKFQGELDEEVFRTPAVV